MVLVRKTELACRNSWDQDLWEAADTPVDIQPVMIPTAQPTGEDRYDVPAARSELLIPDPARAGEMFTDRITSISMPTRSQLRPMPSASADIDDMSDDLQDARASVREARRRRQEQRHLERKRHQETVLQSIDTIMDTAAPIHERDRDLGRIHPSEGPFTSSVQHDAPPREPSPPVQPERQRPSSAPMIEFSSEAPRFSRSRVESAPVAPRPTPPSSAHPTNSAPESQMSRGQTEPLPDPDLVRNSARRPEREPEQPVRERRREPATNHAREPKREAPREATVSSRRDSTWYEPFDDEPDELPPAVESRPTNWITGAGNRMPAAPPVLHAEPLSVDPIDLSPELQTIRRCCATCRDFKQVGDGRTGWCNNPYAFAERRMVQSDEIACRTSLGIWWLPYDDHWLEDADTTHHGRPTPYLDEATGSMSAERQGWGTVPPEEERIGR